MRVEEVVSSSLAVATTLYRQRKKARSASVFVRGGGPGMARYLVTRTPFSNLRPSWQSSLLNSCQSILPIPCAGISPVSPLHNLPTLLKPCRQCLLTRKTPTQPSSVWHSETHSHS